MNLCVQHSNACSLVLPIRNNGGLCSTSLKTTTSNFVETFNSGMGFWKNFG